MENEKFGKKNGHGRAAVPAVSRMVLVLGAVASADRPIGISELARQTGLNKSSVHGLISSLVDERMLAPDCDGRGYVLGHYLAMLGARAGDQHLLAAADDVLQALPIRAGSAAFFGRLESERVVVLANRRGSGSLSLTAPPGTSVPLDAGALHKAYLALLGDRAPAQLDAHPPRRFTELSIVERGALLATAGVDRSIGFSTERGEYLPGIAAAAAGVRRTAGVYFFWMVGIDANLDDGALADMGAAVRDAAQELSREDRHLAEQPGGCDEVTV